MDPTALPKDILKKWRVWPYQNTTFLFLSLAIFFYFLKTPHIENFIMYMGNLSYFGSFITGVFFVSAFTAVPASIILFDIADKINPLNVAILAGAGAVIGDYLIFRYMKDKVFSEILPLFSKLPGNFITKIFKTPYFVWLIPLAGAAIIASPLPDEVGISMLGASKIKNWQFLILTFLLNTIGILFIIILSQSI